MSQLSLFSADDGAAEPSDLEGLLAARGQSMLTGQTARISVVVDAPWRADALAELLSAAGLDPSRSTPGPDGRRTVSTAASRLLVPVVRRWRRGAVTAVPAGWTPSSGALRVWFLSAGQLAASGAVDLGIDAAAEQHSPRREELGQALGRAGIKATYVGSRGGGPLLRLGTARARRRLVEAIGAAPEGAPEGMWPS